MINKKLKALEWSQHFSLINIKWRFFSDAQGQLTPQSEDGSGGVIQAFMVVPMACKNEDPI